MSCPIKNKNCEQQMCFRAKRQNNYLCVGINSKPDKTPKDVITVCMRGIHSNTEQQMTISEACYLIQCLTVTITELAERKSKRKE